MFETSSIYLPCFVLCLKLKNKILSYNGNHIPFLVQLFSSYQVATYIYFQTKPINIPKQTRGVTNRLKSYGNRKRRKNAPCFRVTAAAGLRHAPRGSAAELLHALRRQLGTQNYDYHYHNHHVSGVPIMPTLRLDWFMRQSLPLHGGSWHAESKNQNGWYGFGANNASPFSVGGPVNLNNALMKLENAEYEASFQEVHRLPATVRVQETRYERRIWGYCDEDHGLQCCHDFMTVVLIMYSVTQSKGPKLEKWENKLNLR